MIPVATVSPAIVRRSQIDRPKLVSDDILTIELRRFCHVRRKSRDLEVYPLSKCVWCNVVKEQILVLVGVVIGVLDAAIVHAI